MKSFRNISKKILFVSSFALLLQSASVSQAAWYDTIKQKATGVVDRISSKAKEAFGTISQKVLSYDKEKLFNMVQSKMQSAGVRVRRIVNCMATGKECSVADRVLLVGSASFIFVALLALAGSSIGAAARSQIVEKAKVEQGKQVKGWGPAQMAQRLSNMFNRGRNEFLSLKGGIIAGRLTAGQRNFLVGLGASIIGATLLLAAALTAVAVYSKNQEDKEAARIKAEEERQRMEDERIKKAMEERQADIEQTEEDILNIMQADDPTKFMVKGTGPVLEFEEDIGDDKPTNPFMKFFNQNFKLVKANAKKLNEAIRDTVQKGKQKVFKSADNAANFFLYKIGMPLKKLKSDLSDFSIKDMVKNLLGIDLGVFMDGMRSVASRVADLRNSLNTALSRIKDVNELERQFRAIGNYLEKLVDDPIEYLKEKKETIKGKLLIVAALPKLFKPAPQELPFEKYALIPKKQRQDYLLKELSPQEYANLNKIHQQAYDTIIKSQKKEAESWKNTKTVREKLREVLGVYPRLVDEFNNKLNLPFVGELMETMINATVGAAIQIALLTNELGGKLGKFASSDELAVLLKGLKDHVASFANNVKTALSKRIFNQDKVDTEKTLKELLKNFTKGGKTVAQTFFSKIKPILKQVEKVKPQLLDIKERLDEYVKQSSNAIENIKAAARDVKANPLKNITRFPRIVRDKVAEVAGRTKKTLTTTVKDAAEVLSKLKINDVIAEAIQSFRNLNGLLKVEIDGEKRSLINEKFIEEIEKIILYNYVNINEVVKKMSELFRRSPQYEEAK